MNTSRIASLLSYEPADASERILDITIGDALRTAAANWPDHPALIEGLSEPAARRRWTFSQALREAESVGRALALRFRPSEHIAIWAANLPEWFLVEFGAALAGLTLVTVNPASLAAELGFVLKQSRACGVLVQDHYRSRDLLATVAAARDTLPDLREVIPLSTWPELTATAASDGMLPKRSARGRRPDSVHVGNHWRAKRSKAHASQPRQQRPALRPHDRGTGSRYLGEPDADVSHRRLRALHSWRAANGRGAGDASRIPN